MTYEEIYQAISKEEKSKLIYQEYKQTYLRSVKYIV